MNGNFTVALNFGVGVVPFFVVKPNQKHFLRNFLCSATIEKHPAKEIQQHHHQQQHKNCNRNYIESFTSTSLNSAYFLFLFLFQFQSSFCVKVYTYISLFLSPSLCLFRLPLFLRTFPSV